MGMDWGGSSSGPGGESVRDLPPIVEPKPKGTEWPVLKSSQEVEESSESDDR